MRLRRKLSEAKEGGTHMRNLTWKERKALERYEEHQRNLAWLTGWALAGLLPAMWIVETVWGGK